MVTFEDPKQDADELAEAARALAYATRSIEVPAETYEVLGSLHATVASFQQSLNQLADWHHHHSSYAATDSGDRTVGAEHAVKAGGWLPIASASVAQVVNLVMAAQTENGRIAWQPTPQRADQVLNALTSREAALTPGPLDGYEPERPGEGLSR